MDAIKHTTMALYFNSTNDNVRGNKKSANPVILFISVCSIANLRSEIIPYTILTVFIKAIIAIHP